jgi:hypothetical protein
MVVDFNARRAAAIFAAAGIFLGGLGVYHAVSGEWTGSTVAIESHGKRIELIPILRTSAPKEFRRANDLFWAAGILGFGVGAIGIYFFRELSDCD